MAILIRDPRFSMSLAPAEMHCAPSRSRVSYPKRLERQFINLWKMITNSSRRRQRASILSTDFTVITSRRRSTMPAQLYRRVNA